MCNDFDKIFNTIVNVDAPAQAKEAAATLAETWVRECAEHDAKDRTIAVEAGFYVKLAPNTFIVGAQDRLATNDTLPLFGCEWKTTGKGSPARGSYRGWNAEFWYDEISRAHQVGTYALGIKYGTFVDPRVHESVVELREPLHDVNILVRAISKSSPPQIWPDARGAFVTISPDRMDKTRNAYLNAALHIRASRKSGLVPVALPGYSCVKYSKYPCGFYKVCHEMRQPKAARPTYSNLSPGSARVLDALYASHAIDDPDALVILSATSYGEYRDCPEKERQSSLGQTGSHEDDGNDNLNVGKVFHEAMATFYGG